MSREWPPYFGSKAKAEVEVCGAENADYPGEYACTYPRGHDPIPAAGTEIAELSEPGAMFDHASPQAGAWWNNADTLVNPGERERNALRWIAHLAQLHYVGQAFEPEHMRDLANLALGALGDPNQVPPLPDFDAAMATGRERAQEWLRLFEQGEESDG